MAIVGIVGTALAVMVARDYRKDREWCRQLIEIYDDLYDNLDGLNMRDEEIGSSSVLDSIDKKASDLEEHIEEEYPNYRQEERKKGAEIVDDLEGLAPPLHLPPSESEIYEQEKKMEERMHATDTNDRARDLMRKIESAKGEISYGLKHFIEDIFKRNRRV